ncbi:MAG: thermonuclease family protein [Acidobacteriota bacterium]|nr:thermonuclease family protein [Acidobacteriota bacterium]
MLIFHYSKLLKYVFCSLLIACLFSWNSFADSGVVTAVYDGDTIKVRFESGLEKKVRLIGINTPEIDSLKEEKIFKALMAKRFAFYYLYSKKIDLSYDWEREDKYGRLLAYVWTENNGLFNEFILREGFAYVFLKYPFRKDYREKFIKAIDDAKKAERGFWKKGSFPCISMLETRKNIGRLLSVKYRCFRVEARGKFVYLHSRGEEFSSLIQRKDIRFFPDIGSFEGRIISVTGFLEEYKGKPQIMVLLPKQIKFGELNTRKVI